MFDATRRCAMKISLPVTVACAAASLTLILSIESWAAAVPIANPGFESPVLADNGFVGSDLIGGGSLGIPGWSLFNPSSLTYADLGVWNVSSVAYPAEAPEGSNVSFLWTRPADIGSGPIGIQQTLTERLASNTRYDLSVRIGDPLDYAPAELSGLSRIWNRVTRRDDCSGFGSKLALDLGGEFWLLRRYRSQAAQTIPPSESR